MYGLIKPILFRLDPERAHHLTTSLLVFASKIPLLRQLIARLFRLDNSALERTLWGLRFKNPVGLAAGFDKDGKYIDAMSLLGFGFIEVGTVTPKPQVGNPKPRLFRLIEDEAIINRMGFNNEGVDFLVERLKRLKKHDLIVGGNIGKNKDTPLERAHEDYEICFKKLYYYVDYFVVNVSSPNTPGLRSLQEREPLTKILNSLLVYRDAQTVRRPILLKIAPDLNEDLLKDVIDIVQELRIEGIISSNTTISRSPLIASANRINEIGNGGLSGAPLLEKSNQILKQIKSLAPELPIIGVGGIDSAETAAQKIELGAGLIQIYSGLIYKGPFLIKTIKRALSRN